LIKVKTRSPAKRQDGGGRLEAAHVRARSRGSRPKDYGRFEGNMQMKSFLVPVGGAGSDECVLETALAAARPFAAHLNFLHVHVSAGQAAVHSPHADFATGPALRETLAELEHEAKVRTRTAEQHVRDFFARSQVAMAEPGKVNGAVTASWRVEQDDALRRIVFHARHNDLIIAGRAKKPNGLPPDFVESVLIDCGRPVLLASAAPRQSLTGTILVCWKESAEAARAFAAATPLLRNAGRAIFASVAETNDGAAESMQGIARQCALSGIAAETRLIAPSGRSPEVALAAAAKEYEADLVVMGAYGHSRMREPLFGGCTRAFISHAEQPVLLMH
jgi:nucleotide-binding universal stress UspA family protein